MLRLSIPVRHALARLTLPLTLFVAAGLVLAGQASPQLGTRLRISVDTAFAPLYEASFEAAGAIKQGAGAVTGWYRLHDENQRLRAANETLRQWRAVALALAAQNAALRSELHFVPSPKPDFFTARVIADAGGLYTRSVLAAIPHDGRTATDAIAMDGDGLVGRVIEAGRRSARILLITDINSRIPVSIGAQGSRALMVGANMNRPRLIYWRSNAPPREGMVVVTSAIGGVFPAGLPVGTVHYIGKSDPVVSPFAALDRLRIVRLFEYRHIGTALNEMTPASRADSKPSPPRHSISAPRQG